jgi:hypothetical protein
MRPFAIAQVIDTELTISTPKATVEQYITVTRHPDRFGLFDVPRQFQNCLKSRLQGWLIFSEAPG